MKAETSTIVDRSIFNYGRALGAPRPGNNPWDANDAGRQYEHVAAYTRGLAEISTTFAHASWKLDMALKAVRDSENISEQTRALQELQRVYLEIDRATERCEATNGLKWYRYGRIGNVLRHFKPR